MKKYEHNPRQWTKKQREQLENNLRLLGDLSGIVHDLNSDQIVGGNFRSDVMDINKCQITLVKQFDEPDEQGTVAFGFVVWENKLYAYRQVRWTKEQCDRACISANAMGGDFDYNELANYFSQYDLTEFGLDLWEQPKEDKAPATTEEKIRLTIDFATDGERSRFIALMKDKIEQDFDCQVN